MASIQIRLPAEVTKLQPVFVTAPTARNGVTLVQRLLNSSRRIIVYGENNHLCESLPSLAEAFCSIQATFGEQFDQAREKFLRETTEFWTSNLWPDARPFVDLGVDTFCRAVMLYERGSRECGFARWGIKHPTGSQATIRRLAQLLPSAKFVFIYRNLFDVARSAKARGFISTPAQCAAFAQQWQANVLPVLQQPGGGLPPGRLMLIRHESLTADRDRELRRLAEFTGIEGMKPEVLDRRINTFGGGGDGRPGAEAEDAAAGTASSYVEPKPLDGEERGAIGAAARQALEAAKYVDAT